MRLGSPYLSARPNRWGPCRSDPVFGASVRTFAQPATWSSFFNNIKHCRRVATRYDKLAALSLNINLSKWPIYKEVAPNSLNREQGISRPEQGNMQYQAATALVTALSRSHPMPNVWAVMVYLSVWERLSDATVRVMKTAGLSKDVAQSDICRAIADGIIKIRCKPGRHTTEHMTASKTALEGKDFQIPTEIEPEDLAARP